MIQKTQRIALTFTVLAILSVLASASLVLAEINSYTLSWYSVDSGGDTSSGDTYSLQGSAGQPDAGTLSGQGYTIEGGFWHSEQTGILEPTGRIYLPFSLKK